MTDYTKDYYTVIGSPMSDKAIWFDSNWSSIVDHPFSCVFVCVREYDSGTHFAWVTSDSRPCTKWYISPLHGVFRNWASTTHAALPFLDESAWRGRVLCTKKLIKMTPIAPHELTAAACSAERFLFRFGMCTCGRRRRSSEPGYDGNVYVFLKSSHAFDRTHANDIWNETILLQQ